MTGDSRETFDAILPLLRHGAALHWLQAKSKRPVEEKWSTAPRYDEEALRRRHFDGANVGIRLGEPSLTPFGYLHAIDLDIRDPVWEAEAWSKLIEIAPGARSLPSVVSGSGGSSRHLYFFLPKPLKSQKLVISDGFSDVFDPKQGRNVRKRHWEIELFGTGKQVALPPSIHPDTGLPYRWERQIEWLLCDLGMIPSIDLEIESADWADDEDDLFALTRQLPMGLERDRIDGILESLPEDWVEDRETWLQVGAALSHEFQGSQEGFEIWCEWSQQSAKFKLRDQRAVWKSFKGSKNPIRMATLIKAAGQARYEKSSGGWMEELLGDGVSNLPATLTADDQGENAQADKPPIDWKSLLQYTEEGGIKSTLPNLCLLLKNDPRTRDLIKYNDFQRRVVLRGTTATVSRKAAEKPLMQLVGPLWTVTDQVNGTVWTDFHDSSLRRLLESQKGQAGYDLKVSDRDLRAAVDIVASENNFHPVREYLNRAHAAWDGQRGRVANMFPRWLGAEPSDYHRMIAMLMAVGAVTRAFEPGHKFDFVVILEGGQGKGKSTWVQTLGRNWSRELSTDMGEAVELVNAIMGAWIVEIPELSSLNRTDFIDLKAAVSRTVDTVRLPYGKRAEDYPRQCIFIGTTNEDAYFNDDTGARRFWPVACNGDSIDIKGFAAEVDQIWGEAVEIYREMRARQPGGTLPLFINDEKVAEAAMAIQASRKVETLETVMAGKISAWLAQPIGTETGFDDLDPTSTPKYRKVTCTPEIWEKCLGREGLPSRNDQMLISRAMKLVPGWLKHHHRLAGHELYDKYGRVRLYFKMD